MRWASANPLKLRTIAQRHYKKHKAKRMALHRAIESRSRTELRDSYIKKQLTQGSQVLRHSDIPEQLVATKRIQLKIKRLCKTSRTSKN